MQEEVISSEESPISKKRTQYTIEQVERSILDNEKGMADGLSEWKLVEGEKWGFVIKARSTTKFAFQIVIWILIYCMVLSSLMIFRNNAPPYAHILMVCIVACAVGVGISITLYLFYPHIAPRVFDLHHGFFYTRPLSFYIHIFALDQSRTNITPLHTIRAIQIIRREDNTKWRLRTLDQTNLVLEDGRRIPLMIQKNALISQIKEDAQKLATRLVVPVWDMSIITP